MSAEDGSDSRNGRRNASDAWIVVAQAWTDAACAWFARSNPERARAALVEALASFHVAQLRPGEGIEIVIIGKTLTERERSSKTAYGTPEEAAQAIRDETSTH